MKAAWQVLLAGFVVCGGAWAAWAADATCNGAVPMRFDLPARLEQPIQLASAADIRGLAVVANSTIPAVTPAGSDMQTFDQSFSRGSEGTAVASNPTTPRLYELGGESIPVDSFVARGLSPAATMTSITPAAEALIQQSPTRALAANLFGMVGLLPCLLAAVAAAVAGLCYWQLRHWSQHRGPVSMRGDAVAILAAAATRKRTELAMPMRKAA